MASLTHFPDFVQSGTTQPATLESSRITPNLTPTLGISDTGDTNSPAESTTSECTAKSNPESSNSATSSSLVNTETSKSENKSARHNGDDNSPSPTPGSVYIISSVNCGGVITLLGGKIVLAKPGVSHGAIYWECEEKDGWLGFRNMASGNYLGWDRYRDLACFACEYDAWEKFRIEPSETSQGGYILLTTEMDRNMPDWLSPIVLDTVDGKEKLVKKDIERSNGVAWEFIKA